MEGVQKRARWVIGNWKQNLLRGPAEALAQAVVADMPDHLLDSDDAVRVGIAPTYLAIDAVRPWTRPAGPLYLFAQDVAAQEDGAFTGEVGPAMILDAGARGAIVGHSERRAYFGETDATVARKVRISLDAGLRVVLCVGEPLEVRKAGRQDEHVLGQLHGALSNLPEELFGDRLIIAYEPVWAIGTGVAATPADAAAMHRRIRVWLGEHFGRLGSDRSILYGGSVKAGNAAELVAAGDIDGFLVGGASLDAASFISITQSVAGP